MRNTLIDFPAEWTSQDAVMIAWPHVGTDWAYMLDEVTECFVNIASSILECEDLIVVADDLDKAKHDLENVHSLSHAIHYYHIPTNDTWARDFGALTVLIEGVPTPLDFKFNAWGMKFAADKDNLINQRLDLAELFKMKPINHLSFVLEGGSVESDGAGTVMTTSRCLLSPNRNGGMTKAEIEFYLKQSLGAKKILWLNHGDMPGDDTDGHIDTIARFAPNNVILYNGSSPSGRVPQKQLDELQSMKEELQTFTNAEGLKYNLIELPVPDPIFDEEGLQLPATYANFLVMNSRVLVPVYGQAMNDDLALKTIEVAFPEHQVIGIDCNALIKQHGSLHCVTMQFPKNTLNL